MVPGDPQDIAAFLRAHAPPGIPDSGAGQLSTAGGQTISYDVIDAERGNSGGSPAELDFTVAALGAGMAGIRADAEVVPADATCSYSGGPAPVPAAASHGNSVAGSRRLSSRPLDGGCHILGASARSGAASGSDCPVSDAAEPLIVGVVVAPDDVAADHAGLRRLTAPGGRR
jgi:hypothetical protein